MSEQRTPYLAPTTIAPSRWADLYFDDGKHTGVRVLLGTTLIEVKRDGRSKVIDISECQAIEVRRK